MRKWWGGLSERVQWVLISLLPLLGYWTHGLFDLDEGFYGAVISEMNWRGEWIVPYYQGVPWFEKPILLYWVGKPFAALLGPDFGLRLPIVLTSVLLTVLVGKFANRHFGEGKGTLAVLCLTGSLLWAAVSRQLMTDTLLAATWCLAVLWSWESRSEGIGKAAAVGVMLGLGVLAKGPVAVILFIPLGISGLILSRSKPNILGTLAGTVSMLAVIAAWYIPVYSAEGKLFVDEFLIRQNVGRFTGGDAAHTWVGPQNWIFFVPVLLVGCCPWSVWFVRTFPKREEALRFYLALAAVIPFAFFTVSGAKLVHYVLPCIPFIVLSVVGSGRFSANTRAAWVALGCVTVLANLALPAYYYLGGQGNLHALARYLHKQTGDVVAYQMPRREGDRGTGQLKLRETSHPSAEVYVGRLVLNCETLDLSGDSPVIGNPNAEPKTLSYPLWILTRDSRELSKDWPVAPERVVERKEAGSYVLIKVDKP